MAKARIYVPSSSDDAEIHVSMTNAEGDTVNYGSVVNGQELEYDDSLPKLEGPFVGAAPAPLTSPPAPTVPPAPEGGE